MVNSHQAELSASEISNLWISYQNDSMAICGITYYLAHIDDPDIRKILEFALTISKEHIEKVTNILKAEHYPIPIGFTKEDVDLSAPRLFTDKLYLLYILNMGKFGLSSYGLALSLVAREDIVKYYTDCLEETKRLHNAAKKLAIQKGLYVRPSVLPKPKEVDFVTKQNFLTGYVGNRRPLLAIEIGNLTYSAKRNALGQGIIIGFSQVAENKKVRKYFERGRDISKKHFEVLNSILEEEFLNGAINMAQEVTDSTVSPFSDKLMMYHISTLIASGIGQYGIAMSSSPRHDLGVTYGRLMTELIHFADDGANIMIDNGWMEQPPKATNRKGLAKA